MRSGVARRLFALLLAVTAVYRLSLLDRGALAFVDETFYFTSVMALQSLAAGDVHDAIADISMARGRNGASILQMPVAALQAIPAHFGVPASNLRSLLIPTACNVVITLLSLYFVFSIGVILCGSDVAALATAVVYALLVNSNVYIRHLLPYDWALAVGLGALWLGFTRRSTPALAVVTGLLTGAVLTIYTGYYPLCGVVGVAMLWHAWASSERRNALRFAVLFSASSACAVIAMELLFRAGGLSYIESLRGVHRDIVFTGYDDGWVFVAEYLLDVERPSGIVLIGGAAIYVWRLALRIRHGSLRPIDRLLVPFLAAWAAQATASIYLNAIPLYGRLIHPWMPFLVWMLADSIAAISLVRARTLACAAVAVAAMGSWVVAAREYLPLTYPPDVRTTWASTRRASRQARCCASSIREPAFTSPAPLNRATGYPYRDEHDYVLLNFCQALPAVTRPKDPAVIPTGATRVVRQPALDDVSGVCVPKGLSASTGKPSGATAIACRCSRRRVRRASHCARWDRWLTTLNAEHAEFRRGSVVAQAFRPAVEMRRLSVSIVAQVTAAGIAAPAPVIMKLKQAITAHTGTISGTNRHADAEALRGRIAKSTNQKNLMVARGGIEPSTLRFSVVCSTN